MEASTSITPKILPDEASSRHRRNTARAPGRFPPPAIGNGGLPAGQMHVRGACAWERPVGDPRHGDTAMTDIIIVEVIGKPATGSFG
ncbi:hypothetical protein [Nocardia shimofusensis]|uniref:hypothetical protein n=1 Tax=Nocardia shimofusensis TaxID=228596 RepID=UPI0012EDD472|nr:hypothetical protein [Nocardia shimofusensis]